MGGGFPDANTHEHVFMPVETGTLFASGSQNAGFLAERDRKPHAIKSLDGLVQPSQIRSNRWDGCSVGQCLTMPIHHLGHAHAENDQPKIQSSLHRSFPISCV